MAKRSNLAGVLVVAAVVAFPFVVAVVSDGLTPSAVLDNRPGNALFIQGLLIEVFILALYALSYDLVLGVTGVLSFGHAMLFAAGAYGSGIALKTFGLGLTATVGVVALIGVAMALVFAVLLPRVRGITYALVTLGIASMFHIIVQSTELQRYTGADVGLQGIPAPTILDTTTQRFRFYVVAFAVLVAVYALYRRFVDSPTGRVCVGIRENEERAQTLGYDTFWFKLTAITLSSIGAAFAGMLHALHQPIVSPNVAGLGWTVTALLIILIGGIGTLSGAILGAAVFRLLQFYLNKWFGGTANLLIGMAYVGLVLFFPTGIVGTWRTRRHGPPRRLLPSWLSRHRPATPNLIRSSGWLPGNHPED